ncbi:MAG: GIY-YIG nuclease family protein, partial [Cyclobacteriaceae bacterium]|nr:GIY-YIG nuclease family protein [Cyclobacteriaceae bacterium]
MVYFVYVIKSFNFDYTYVGHTNDLKHRLIDHNKGKTRSNKAFKPFNLLYFET